MKVISAFLMTLGFAPNLFAQTAAPAVEATTKSYFFHASQLQIEQKSPDTLKFRFSYPETCSLEGMATVDPMSKSPDKTYVYKDDRCQLDIIAHQNNSFTLNAVKCAKMCAEFNPGTFRERPESCDVAAVKKERARFQELFDTKKYEEAATVLEKVMVECEDFLPETMTSWLKSDLALTALKNSDPVQCLTFLKEVSESTSLDSDNELRKAVETNERLCLSAYDNKEIRAKLKLPPNLKLACHVLGCIVYAKLLGTDAKDLIAIAQKSRKGRNVQAYIWIKHRDGKEYALPVRSKQIESVTYEIKTLDESERKTMPKAVQGKIIQLYTADALVDQFYFNGKTYVKM